MVRRHDQQERAPQGDRPAGQRTFQHPVPGRIIPPMTASRPWLLVVPQWRWQCGLTRSSRRGVDHDQRSLGTCGWWGGGITDWNNCGGRFSALHVMVPCCLWWVAPKYGASDAPGCRTLVENVISLVRFDHDGLLLSTQSLVGWQTLYSVTSERQQITISAYMVTGSKAVSDTFLNNRVRTEAGSSPDLGHITLDHVPYPTLGSCVRFLATPAGQICPL